MRTSLLAGLALVAALGPLDGKPPAAVAALLRTNPTIGTLGCEDERRCRLYVYEERDPLSARLGLQGVIAHVGAELSAIEIRPLGHDGGKLAGFKTTASGGDLVLVNGGFFGYGARDRLIPLGLVVAEGRQRSARRLWRTGGVLQVVDGRTSIVRQHEYQRPARFALQSKPLIVENGYSGIRSDDGQLADRTSVGLCANGDVVIAGAFSKDGQAMSLFEFASFQLASSARIGCTLVTALGMDGGPSSSIFVPRRELFFGADVDNYLPNIVAVTRVQKTAQAQ